MAESQSITSHSGIYLIRCIPTGKVYVGSTVNIKRRWHDHKKRLLSKTHDNHHLQRAWNKYGRDAFRWEILEHVEPVELREREQQYIDLYCSYESDNGFNLSPTAGSILGFKKTPEQIERTAQARRGMKHSAESKALMSRSAKTRPPLSPETHAKKLAFRQSSESRSKISKSLSGKKLSAEHRSKIAACHIGKKFSPEQIKILIAAQQARRNREALRKAKEQFKVDNS